MNKSTKVSRKVFYGNAYLYFILAALLVIVGFFPSYFKRFAVTDSGHHFHGITASLWILLLIIQPFLYRIGNMKWHSLIGKVSFVLVPLVIVGGLNMVHLMLIGKANYPPIIPYQLAFIDFFTLLQFLLFYVLAIAYRRDIQHHARYMVCTVLGPLIPALTRMLFLIPIIDSFDKSLNISFVIIEVVLLLLLLDDKRTGKIRFPYKMALALFAVQHLLMNFAAQWEWWRNLMDAFQGL